MTLIKKIMPLALALGVGIGFNGDLTAQEVKRMMNPKEYATIEEAMEVLDIKEEREICRYLPDGYKTSMSILSQNLTELAGIYVGSVEVKKTKNGYCAKGYYSQQENPEEMLRVLSEADTNGDKIITEREAECLQEKVLEEYLIANKKVDKGLEGKFDEAYKESELGSLSSHVLGEDKKKNEDVNSHYERSVEDFAKEESQEFVGYGDMFETNGKVRHDVSFCYEFNGKKVEIDMSYEGKGLEGKYEKAYEEFSGNSGFGSSYKDVKKAMKKFKKKLKSYGFEER